MTVHKDAFADMITNWIQYMVSRAVIASRHSFSVLRHSGEATFVLKLQVSKVLPVSAGDSCSVSNYRDTIWPRGPFFVHGLLLNMMPSVIPPCTTSRESFMTLSSRPLCGDSFITLSSFGFRRARTFLDVDLCLRINLASLSTLGFGYLLTYQVKHKHDQTWAVISLTLLTTSFKRFAPSCSRTSQSQRVMGATSANMDEWDGSGWRTWVAELYS